MSDWTGGTTRARLELIHHSPDLLQEPHGFGGFLFDTNGALVEQDGWTWLYTTVVVDGRWESWVRRYHLGNRFWEPARPVLWPRAGRDRAVLHHIVKVADDFIVGFFCDGRGVGAALAPAPDAPFTHDRSFALHPEVGWETRSKDPEGWSLESNGGYVLCVEDENSLVFWQGYDSYHKECCYGDLGWAKLRVDKPARRVALIERHPKNPIKFRDPSWLCARCGGNLDSRVTIDGKHPFFFYTRPTRDDLSIGLALSGDPLFLENVSLEPFDRLYGDERVAEKFEMALVGGCFHLFYENRLADETWHTGLRIYRLS